MRKTDSSGGLRHGKVCCVGEVFKACFTLVPWEVAGSGAIEKVKAVRLLWLRNEDVQKGHGDGNGEETDSVRLLLALT